MTRPNFFIVGAPKCGTTAMDSYLSQHPEVFMAQKEMHYLCSDLTREPHRRQKHDEAWYLGKFAGAGDARVVGEGSVFYLCSKTAAQEIHAYAPEARILIHLRNPMDYLPSHHAQVVYEGYEDITDFPKAWDASGDRARGLRIPAACPYDKILNYRAMADFARQVERYFDVFGHDRVRVVLFDDFKADTPATYASVLDFLGVEDTTFQPDFKVINPTKRVRNRKLQKFLRETPDWVTSATAVVPKDTKLRVKRWLRKQNTDFSPRAPLDPAFKRRMAAELRPDIDRLERLLDRDLGHWCRVPAEDTTRAAS